MNLKASRLVGCMVAGLGWMMPGLAFAQVAPGVSEAAPRSDRGLADIVVTAQKREESLQDTPIAISVMDGEALEKMGLTTFSDFASGAVPSLRVVPFNGNRPSLMNVVMRGITPGDPSQISRDQTVGIYMDGVYLGRA